MYMSDELLREYIELVMERENDDRYLRTANNSYIAISKLLYELQNSSDKVYSQTFTKDKGKYRYLYLQNVLPRPEHEGVYLELTDRNVSKTKKTVSATAGVAFDDETNTRQYIISVFLDIPESDPKLYNELFKSTVAKAFAKPENREHFIHEFVHVLDFRRLTDEYIKSRAATKQSRKESGLKKDFNAYVNDPLESNAYTHESFVKVQNMLKGVKSLSKWQEIMGNDVHQFVDKFMTTYLDKRARKHWSEENKRKVLKRAVSFYERALERAPS